ncbi:hypothetical protein EDB83DRAFT_2417544 [Lactarius deliciosus]|nr:hypothetical protein EDB83DRAFT_2417544 [Lactarius deliciosus]
MGQQHQLITNELAQPRQWPPPFICVSSFLHAHADTCLYLYLWAPARAQAARVGFAGPRSYTHLRSPISSRRSLSTSPMPDHIRHVASSSLAFSLTLPPPIFPKTNLTCPQDSLLNVSTTISCTAAHLCLEGPRVTGDVSHSVRWDLITTR